MVTFIKSSKEIRTKGYTDLDGGKNKKKYKSLDAQTNKLLSYMDAKRKRILGLP